jgi:nucleotide-binding universal stress UspA family protein
VIAVDAGGTPDPDLLGAVRHVLVVTADDEPLAGLAATLACRHGARVTLVEAWRPSSWLFGLALAPVAVPVTRADAVESEEAAAETRVRRAARTMDCCGLEFRCRRGSVRGVARREARTGRYDAIVVRARRRPGLELARRLLELRLHAHLRPQRLLPEEQ